MYTTRLGQLLKLNSDAELGRQAAGHADPLRAAAQPLSTRRHQHSAAAADPAPASASHTNLYY